MAASFLTGPLPTRADSVYLHSVTDVYQTDSASVYPGDSYWGPATDFTRYDTRYTRGLGYRQVTTSTNYYSRNYSANGTAKTDGCLNYSSYVLTNSITNGWLNGALTSGPNTLNTIYTESRWTAAGSNWTHSITLSAPDGDTISNFSPPDSSQFQPPYYRGMDYVATTVEANGDGGTNTATTTILVTHIVKLETDAPTGGTGSALYRLTSGFGIPSGTNVNVLAENAAKYTLAHETPDTNGVVWKIFTDGTTNDFSVRIRDDYACDVTNFTFHPTPNRATLGIQWKSAATNQTNWDSGPLYVLKGTTVLFRVQATVGGIVETNVAWPTGTPAWNAGTNLSEQISVTFDTLSSTTNGHWITVTAGSIASNQVVVFDYAVKFQPAEEPGKFAGRADYPTDFGVGEGVVFVAVTDPSGLSLSLAWNATGMHSGGNQQDHSLYAPSSANFTAGAFVETNKVTATLTSAPSSGSARTNTFCVIRPTGAVLKDLTITNVPFLSFPGGLPHLVPNTNVGHDINTETSWKKSLYFILPQTVSFHGIQVREGAGPYTLGNGLFTIPPGTPTNGTFTFTSNPWRPPSLASGPLVTTSVTADAQHTPGAPRNCSHQVHLATGATEPNYLHWDRFGISPPGNPNLPYPLAHQSVRLCDLVGRIAIEFQLNSGTFYHITDVNSRREFYSDATLVIDKAGSGPHPKSYASPSTPDE